MKIKNYLKNMFLLAVIVSISLFTACDNDDGEAGIEVTAGFTFVNTPETGIVQFTNTTTVTPTTATGLLTYEWNFGDGSDISTEASPLYTYEEVGDYTVTLTVKVTDDEATDVSTQTVSITAIPPDVTAPEITLLGDAQIVHEIGTEFTDPGVTALDDRDGDITVNVTSAITIGVETPVDAINVYDNQAYTITYTVSDETGNTATAERIVLVQGDPDNVLISVENIGALTLPPWTFEAPEVGPIITGKGQWPQFYGDNAQLEIVEIEDEFGTNKVLKLTSQLNLDSDARRGKEGVSGTKGDFPRAWAVSGYKAVTDFRSQVSAWEPNTTYELSFDLWSEEANAREVYIGFHWMGDGNVRQLADCNDFEGTVICDPLRGSTPGEPYVQPTTEKQRFTVLVKSPDLTQEQISTNDGTWFAGPEMMLTHPGVDADPNPYVYFTDNWVMKKVE